jgi:hypothetical protein
MKLVVVHASLDHPLNKSLETRVDGDEFRSILSRLVAKVNVLVDCLCWRLTEHAGTQATKGSKNNAGEI